jgi:hypothetical protein
MSTATQRAARARLSAPAGAAPDRLVVKHTASTADALNTYLKSKGLNIDWKASRSRSLPPSSRAR